MKLRLPGSIKGMVTLIVMLSLLPALGIIAVTSYNKAHSDLGLLGEEALHSVENILRRQGQLVESTRTLLLILSDLPEVREQNAEACEKLFQQIMLHEPAYANIRLMDEWGDTIASGKPDPIALSLLELRQLLGAAHSGFAVRELTQAQEGDTSSFVCVFPVQAGKRTQAVLMAAIHITVTQAELAGLAAKHVARLHLVNKNGRVLYGYPSRDPDHAVEARERSNIWKQIRDSSETSGMLLTSTGNHIFYEKVSTPGGSVPDITAIVVIAGSTILSHTTEQHKSSILLLGGLLLAAIVTALRLSNISLLAPMKTLLHTARQIKEGNLSARTDDTPMPQEFRQLAESLDSMAASLEKRDRDLVEARDAANEGNQAKSDFLANMSHEIRTPMNAILGMTYLTRQSQLTEQQRGYIDNIHSEAEKLLVTVNDILDFSKIEAGKLQIEHVVFDLPGVLAKTVAAVRQEAEKKGVAFSASLPSESYENLLGDPFHLSQLLGNLLGNAIKVTERGPVHFACSLETPDHKDAALHCRITDGSGDMKAEELARLFEDHKDGALVVERGFSLNLALTQRLLQLMQGEIEACYEDDGGTHITFRLPFARSATAKSEEDANTPALSPDAAASGQAGENDAGTDSLEGVRILLVEDNVINQQIAEDILSGFGASVQIASNGLEALDLLHMDPAAYDVVLMDLYMPELDGIAATKRIRMDNRLAHLPVIAMTAQAKGPEWDSCLQAGMNDIAVKPIDVPSLLATIKKWTSRRP